MTTSVNKTAKPVGDLFEVQDSAGGLSFYGELLSEVRTNVRRTKLRWTEMALYRITHGPRTGEYILDDRKDSRMVTYDELFREWEKMLRFQIKGRDAEES